jgi:hypothetical protein
MINLINAEDNKEMVIKYLIVIFVFVCTILYSLYELS